MKIGFVQLKPQFGDKDGNLHRAISFLENADAAVMVLPELFDTGYIFESRAEALMLSSPINESRTVKELKRLSKAKKMAIVAGVAERENDKVYNSAITALPDGGITVYRKVHLFYKEKQWFDPGNIPINIVNFREARLGMMICFDWIFPEMARSLALKGANLICHPSNLVLPFCQNAMITRCLENRVFAVTCNRIGEEIRGNESFKFTGFSRIISPDGMVLCEAGRVKEEMGIVDINVKAADNKKITSMNDLFEDRRTDYYNS